MKTCRICLVPVSGRYFALETRVENQTAAEIVMFCCGVEIHINDGFAQFICSECWPQILTAHKIKSLCIMSDKLLRGTVKAAEICDTNIYPVKIESEPDIFHESAMGDCIDPETTNESTSFKSNLFSQKIKEEPVDDYENFSENEIPSAIKSSTKFVKTCSKELKKSEKFLKTDQKQPPSRSQKLSSYKCYFCNAIFKKKKLKNEHLKEVHSNDDLKCKLCRHTSYTANGHDNHLMLHENPHLLSNMCHICSKNFQLPCKLRRHIEICHSDKSQRISNYICDLCEFRSFSKANLSRHMKTVHLKIKAFQCPLCPDKKYTSKISFDQHMISKHGQESDFECGVCGLKFPTMSFLRAHMKHKCLRGSTVERVPAESYREQIGDSDNYRCKICSGVFEGKEKIGLHYRQRHKHSNTCDICSAKFYSFANLKKHIRIVHNNIRKHSCSFCGKLFGQRNQLQYHENTHTGEKPYECKFHPCQFRSGDPSTVIKHQKKCPHNLNGN